MRNRIVFGSILGIFLVAAIAAGGYFFRALALLVCILAIHETAGIVMHNSDLFLLGAVYAASSISILTVGQIDNKYIAVLWMAALICIVSIAVCRNADIPDVLHVVFLCVYPTAFLLTVLYGFFCLPRSDSLAFIILASAGPSLCDTFAYFGGMRFGKRKLCPSISPHKTIAGSVFAVIGGLTAGMLTFFIQGLWDGSGGIMFFLVSGLLIGIFSQIGDLFASRIKRWAGVKDYSELIPGHGGVMDRIDSILLTGPVILIMFLLFS